MSQVTSLLESNVIALMDSVEYFVENGWNLSDDSYKEILGYINNIHKLLILNMIRKEN